MSKKNWFIDAAKGAALGTGILPGVSVGTVGIIVNVYDKLIGAIANLRKQFVKSLLTLIPIGIGTIISAVILLFTWQKVISVYIPFIIIAALSGFIIGGLPVILKEFKGHHWCVSDVLRVLLGLVIAGGIGVFSYLSAAGVIPGFDLQEAFNNPYANAWIFPVVLVAGFVAAVACLIPGISGSMVLFILGLYQPIVNLYISNDALGTESIWHDVNRLIPGLLLTLTLLVGILFGFILVSKAMKKMLAEHRLGTFTLVLGFVLGSLVSMFVNNSMFAVYHNALTSQWWQFVAGGIALVTVAIATYFLLKRQGLQQK